MIPTGQDSLKTRSTLEPEARATLIIRWPRPRTRSATFRRLPFSMKVLLENLLRFEDGEDRHPRRPPGDGRLAEGAEDRPRDPVPPGARADAGFHRRSGGRRPRRDARRDEAARRRPAEDQSAGPGPPGHRPQRDGRRIRHATGVRQERRARISAQRRALRVPQMGQPGVRQFPGRAAGHRHLPPGQPRAYRAVRVDRRRTRTARRSLTPTRWSAPTATRPWSTASACSAGASAGSRPRRRCSASRSAC